MRSDSLYERAIVKARSMPEFATMLKAAFLDQEIEAAARRYAESREFAHVTRLVREHFRIGERLSVLDVGGGRGIASFAFALQGHRVTMVEVDPSDIVGAGAGQMLQEKTGIRFRIVEGEVESALEGESFDLVFCRQVLHHARDLTVLARTLRRLTRQGGLLLAIREHVVRTPSDLQKFLSVHASSILGDMGENAYPRERYVEALSDAGFQEVRNAPFLNTEEYFDFSLVRRLLFRLRVAYWPYPGCEYTFRARAA